MKTRAAIHITFGLVAVLFAVRPGLAGEAPGAPETSVAETASTYDDYRSPTYNYCVRSFYDPSMYNWYSFENNCSEPLSITFIPYNPGFGGGAVDYLGPGRKTSTGDSREELQQKQGYELFVCPAGFIAVDGNDRYVTRVNTLFRCKRR